MCYWDLILGNILTFDRAIYFIFLRQMHFQVCNLDQLFESGHFFVIAWQHLGLSRKSKGWRPEQFKQQLVNFLGFPVEMPPFMSFEHFPSEKVILPRAIGLKGC